MSDARTPDAARHHETSLDDAQQRWNEFVDAIGHELRTPLTAIIGFQELLEDGIYGKLPDPCRGAVGRIGSSAQELLALLNGMVDLARPVQAPPELDLEDVSLEHVFAEARDTGRRLAPERDVRWSDEPASGLGAIRTDHRRLQRAIFLALLAAVRATPGGQLHLSAQALPGGGAELRLRGPAFDDVPKPPLVDIVLHRAREGDDRSLLRLCLAVDTLALLGCPVELVPPATLVIRLLAVPTPGSQ
jgi:signal transduction histidine kinase